MAADSSSTYSAASVVHRKDIHVLRYIITLSLSLPVCAESVHNHGFNPVHESLKSLGVVVNNQDVHVES